MNQRTLVVCLVAALAVFAFGGSAWAMGCGGGYSGGSGAPKMSADEMKTKIAAATTLFTDAKTLTKEAIDGKAVDKTQTVAAGEKPQLKDLTDYDRKARFQSADKKFTEASADCDAVVMSMKSGSNGLASPAPLKTQIDKAHGAELVINVKFLVQKKLSSLDLCLTLIQGVTKIDPNNTEARQIEKDLANQIAAEKAAKTTASTN